MMRVLIPALALAAAMPAVAQPRPSWVSGTYVYADLCTEPHTGSLAGRRITLRRSPNGDDLIYEASTGSDSTALRTAEIRFDDITKEVAFSIDTAAGSVSFHGTAALDLLAGILSDRTGEHPLRLRRVLRSRAHETCRPVPVEPETVTSH